MRISDWSSDVCSSDLLDRVQRRLRRRNGVPGRPAGRAGRLRGVFQPADRAEPGTPYLPRDLAAFLRTGAALDGEPISVQPVLAAPQRHSRFRGLDRKSAVKGKSVTRRVDTGGSGIIEKKQKTIRIN